VEHISSFACDEMPTNFGQPRLPNAYFRGAAAADNHEYQRYDDDPLTELREELSFDGILAEMNCGSLIPTSAS
jgi:hypothetical protein